MILRRSRLILGAVLTAAAFLVAAASSHAASPRIFNGTSLSAPPPWMGFVGAETSTGVSGCGGVAISPNVVLTAAHCIVDEDRNAYIPASHLGVAFGQSDPWGAWGAGALRVEQVVGYYAPSNFRTLSTGGTANDVAVLRLRTRAPGTVPLLPAAKAGLLAAGRPAAVVGWGELADGSVPPALQRGDFAIQGYSSCTTRFPDYDPKTMLCALGTASQSACHGDSGGPLLVSDGSQGLYTVGVVTSGIANCDPAYPDMFSNVARGSLAAFVTWYARQLQQAADSSAPAASRQIAPAPRRLLARTRAIATARAYASRAWGMRVYSVQCTRRSTLRFTCRVEGSRLGRRGWVGRMTVKRTRRGVIVTR
jgi:secreted trypsin-like serine protease